MGTTVDGRARRIVRPARRAAIAASFVAIMFAGGVAAGMGGEDTDGRDGTQPGAPSDAPAPAPIDSDAGRGDSGVGEAPQVSARLIESVGPGAASAAPVANGRGGVDPASGPLPAARARPGEVDAPSLDVGAFDTDSGLAPEPAASARVSRDVIEVLDQDGADAGPRVYVDQDVPGAPTGNFPGANRASNDADG